MTDEFHRHLNLTVGDVEQAVDELTRLGVQFEIYTEGDAKTDERGIAGGDDGNPKIAWFTDPSGNILSIIEMT